MFDNVVAFRLASINFLEKEVLKLWTHVKEFFLNKLILESDQPNPLVRTNRQYHSALNWQGYQPMREYTYSKDIRSNCSTSTEREEVIFWIGCCLSEENRIMIQSIPHFLINNFDWYEFSFNFAIFSGNVACFDYFRNFCSPIIRYEPSYFFQNIFYFHDGEEREHLCFERQLPCFIFFYMLLDSVDQDYLFLNFP